MTIIDAEKARKQIKAMSKHALDVLEAGLTLEAEKIMTRSKRQTPHDLGVLRASGFVDAPTVKGNTVTVMMGYGGAAKGYALAQHEREDYHHKVGSSKYLENPVNAANRGFGKRVTKGLESRL